MAFCTQCGAKLDEGALFCTRCGAKVQSAPPIVAPAVAAESPVPAMSAPGACQIAAAAAVVMPVMSQAVNMQQQAVPQAEPNRTDNLRGDYEQIWSRVEPQLRAPLAELRQRRDKDKKFALVTSAIIAAVAAVAVLVYGVCTGGYKNYITPIATIVMVFGFSWLQIKSLKERKRNLSYKAEVVPQLIEAVFPGAVYNRRGTLTKDRVNESKLFKMKKRDLDCEDSIQGCIGNIPFTYNEAEIYHYESERDSDGNTTQTKVTDFNGFVFEADFNKYFYGMTILSSQTRRLKKDLGWFNDMPKCQLEDPVFNARYDVYTTNDQEARYILTPAIQQRIVEMNDFFINELRGGSLSISFYQNKIFIMASSSYDRFEVKYETESVKSDFLALPVLIDIVEQMNLNLRIWTKE